MVDFNKLNEERKRRERLEKFVGMLGSDHEGEQINALRFIKKIAAEEKKTLTELLLTGGERIVYVDKIVYRDKPQEQPYRRNYDGARGNERRYREHSEKFNEDYEEKKSSIYSRKLLDELKKVGEEGIGILDTADLDFARTVPYEYSWDFELSNRQTRYAEMIIRRFRRNTNEPPI